MKLTVNDLQSRLDYLLRENRIRPSDEIQLLKHSDGISLRAVSRESGSTCIGLQETRGSVFSGGEWEEFGYV